MDACSGDRHHGVSGASRIVRSICELMPQTTEKRKRKPPSRVRKSQSVPVPEDVEEALRAAKAAGFSITPLQLLGVVLKLVLKERITDAEIDRISSVYYDTVKKWFS